MLVEMSIHRALAEIKLLEAKLEKLNGGVYVISNKVTNRTLAGMSIEDFKKVMQSNLDSAKQLLKNRRELKAKVAMSNATTPVVIAGSTYTVAEAIERKNNLKYEKALLNVLKSQYVKESAKVEKENSDLTNKLETYLQSVLGDKGSRDPSTVAEHTRVYNDANRWDLLDPSKLATVIAEMENSISEFEMQVDYTLSESNSLTKISVER